MTDESQILVTSPREGVMVLTLNRPGKRNALSGELIEEWQQALDAAAEDNKTRVVIFAGHGEHFCAGADIAWMQRMAKSSHEHNVQDAMHLAVLLRTIYMFPKPTIALVQGAAMGGGLGVIACSDIVIAADNANFCFSEVKIGITPSVISPYIISVLGAHASRYYFLTAERFDASTAKELGLIQQIVPLETLTDAGLATADKLLKNSPHAISEAKKLIRSVGQEKYSEELIQFTAEHLASMRTSRDAHEGLKAFLEKRNAVWR